MQFYISESILIQNACSYENALVVQVIMVHLKVLGNTVSGDLYFYNKQKTASQMQEETKQRRRMGSNSTA